MGNLLNNLNYLKDKYRMNREEMRNRVRVATGRVIGVDKLSGYLNGKIEIPYEVIIDFAIAFNLSLSDLCNSDLRFINQVAI